MEEVKRSRGRPKKNTEDQVKKPRGRPKLNTKEKIKPSKIKEEIVDNLKTRDLADDKEVMEVLNSTQPKSKPKKLTCRADAKVVLITGATSGMGLELAKQLSALGHIVIGVGRRPGLCRDARNEILDYAKDAEIHYLVTDLSLMSRVKILADDVENKLRELGLKRIDVMIMNAAAMCEDVKKTYESREYMWATNYLSVYYLTKLLEPYLLKSNSARVITMTNRKAAKNVRFKWDKLGKTDRKDSLRIYNETKLADLMFALEYDHRMSNKPNVNAYCVDPGTVNTNLGVKEVGGIRRLIFKFWHGRGKTVEQGIETTLYLALAEGLPKNVVFYKNLIARKPGRFAIDPENRKALFKISELDLES